MASEKGDPPANVCHTCKEPITNKKFLKVGSLLFHQDHFTCAECKVPLHGKAFKPRDGPEGLKFYCIKDYVDKFCPTCKHCGGKITEGRAIQAFGGYYHPEHFVCKICEQPFSESGKYYEHNNDPYCHQHHIEVTRIKCGQCGEPISKEIDRVAIEDKSFHKQCLVCFHCSKPLGDTDTVFQNNSKIYCRDDYLSFFCRRCTACSEHMFEACVKVNDEVYHDDCLKCAVCQKLLEKYICVGGYLRCPEHQNHEMPPRMCDACNKEISGLAIRNQGKVLHQACFVCKLCGKDLDKKTAKAIKKSGKLGPGDHLCCPDCAQATGSAKAGEQKTKELEIDWSRGEKIGQGAFGKVFMAMNKATGELLAVKQIAVKQQNEEQLQEIQKEIRMMENLSHPNIVASLGTQWKGDKLCILMEYVPGKSLDVLLEQFGAFSENTIQSYAHQLVDALAYCHSKHVVHRDIKGKNILVDTQGTLKLADFGSAKEFSNVLSKDAPSISYNYTPLWTAPEVLSGDYNSKVDVWSLGCVLIEMASGLPPWSEEKFENPFRALYHIGNTDKTPAIPDSISPEARAFVSLCLTRDPDKRPTAAELQKHSWLQDSRKGRS